MRILILLLVALLANFGARASERVLEHRYGTTRINGTPERVVSLSFIGHDFLLGLGVAPVALRYWYGDGPFGVWPWAADALGDAEPSVIYGAIDVEAVALLEPDLILAQWSGITETEYALLSKIAPTLPPPQGVGDYGATWQQMTRHIGFALNIERRAEEQIEATEARFADMRARYPHWQGQTAASVWADQIGAYTRADIRGKFFENLGLINAPGVENMVGKNVYNVRISPEDVSPIDTDVLLWLTVGDARSALQRIGLRTTMRSFQKGREIIADPDLTAALSHSSPLAIHYALDRLEPLLKAALDGDPATEVGQ
ncbi:MAG: ABC transporter substrate-binding protein [Marinovum sp.]|nr:ABC transporter substrate-binding protein [Marinovum sp.]